MTSAVPLSVVLSLLSQRKEGKRGRNMSHIWKRYEDYKNLSFKGAYWPLVPKKIFLAGNFLGAIFGLLYHVIKQFFKNSFKKLGGHALEKCLILAYNKRIIKVRSVNWLKMFYRFRCPTAKSYRDAKDNFEHHLHLFRYAKAKIIARYQIFYYCI